MKNSKILLIFILFIISFCLLGCTNNSAIEDFNENEEYSLVSTDNRLVFKKESNYEVYYLNEGITKIEKVRAFANSDYANAYYAKQNALDYKNIKCIDNLVIFEMNEEYLESYADLSRTDIMFSMIEADFQFIEKT